MLACVYRLGDRTGHIALSHYSGGLWPAEHPLQWRTDRHAVHSVPDLLPTGLIPKGLWRWSCGPCLVASTTSWVSTQEAMIWPPFDQCPSAYRTVSKDCYPYTSGEFNDAGECLMSKYQLPRKNIECPPSGRTRTSRLYQASPPYRIARKVRAAPWNQCSGQWLVISVSAAGEGNHEGNHGEWTGPRWGSLPLVIAVGLPTICIFFSSNHACERWLFHVWARCVQAYAQPKSSQLSWGS